MFNCQNFFPALVERVPEFSQVYHEDLELYSEMIPHVFMGDLYPYVIGEYRAYLAGDTDAAARKDIVVRTLAFLEDAMGSPEEEVQTLISISFLEGFLPEESCPGLRELMGPRLRQELSRYEG